MKKINCGGFYIDDESLELEDNVLSVKNGGSSGGVVVLNVDNSTLDKTWQEIHDGIAEGTIFAVVTVSETEAYMDMVITAYAESDSYIVSLHSESMYITDSSDGYPSASVG